jgi:hypothetical protein
MGRFLFTHSITGSAASGEICRNYGLRKFSPRFQRMDGMANRDHCIATDFVISLAKLDHGREGSLQVVGTMESDSISAFVY